MKSSIDYLASVAIKNSPKPSYSCISLIGNTAISHNENTIAWVTDMPFEFQEPVMVTASRLAQALGAAGDDATVSRRGDMVVVSGGSSEFEIPAITGEATPSIPQVSPDIDVPLPGTFCAALAHVSFAHDAPTASSVLSGVHVTSTAIVATDGKLLAEVRGEFPDVTMTVPVIAIPLISACMEGNESASMDTSSGSLSIVSGNRGLRVRLVEGKYPNYKAALPSTFVGSWGFNRKDMIKAVKNAALMSNSSSPAVVLEGDGSTCTVTNMTTNAGKAKTSIAGGPSRKVAFNGIYLNSILSRMSGDEVTANDSGPGKGMVMSEGNCTYLIMPVAIN